jgi:hypothetical protein
MPLMTFLLALPLAHAGTAVWLSGTPNPSLTPSDKARRVEDIAPIPAWGSADDLAIEALKAEVDACRPMLDEFDGELAIIRRLSVRLDAISVVREEDREAVWNALLLQGLAVHRYFPDLDSAEARGVGVVRRFEGHPPENAPWADAIALLPNRLPTTTHLADDTTRIAFQEQRARALLLPTSEVAVNGIPAGATVHIDGRSAPGGVLSVGPGLHRWVVQVDGKVHLRGAAVVAPGGREAVEYRAVAPEVAAVEATLTEAPGAVVLPHAVVLQLATLEAPVSLVVTTKRGPRVFAVEGENAVPVVDAAGAGATARSPHLYAHAGVGWLYDGDFYVHNAAAGAPDALSTVNVVAPVVGLGGQLPIGPVHLGAGADLVLPIGEHSTLPTDDTTLRLRAHPYFAVGYGPASATVGYLLPWHLGVGLRGAVPVTERWAVSGAFVQGLGLTFARDTGPEFTPEASRVGWLGMSWRWPE